MAAQPLSSPPDSADELASALRSVVSRLKRNMRAQSAYGDLTGTQTAVLLRLERDGPASVSELAQAEGIRTQSMGTAVAALMAGGHIVGTPDPDDGRRTILSLTKTSLTMIRKGRSARQDWLSRTIRVRLSSTEQAQVAGAVALLARLVDA
ncbi:MarR family transcriptional regulator [Caballeronia sp. LZ035]|uniref:MarR family winged helix-turn-helix transcriptional regulator n=1 Tax=Caballeronia sp. LZ035 TaxID=3038568 RepID=UPI0028601376|nr:MarR family transcriptional regulator [Caballeronia sp. LZ035]MDR5759186.1 MarR family transcriptional regulator [Caballeronia sp. LZ035]